MAAGTSSEGREGDKPNEGKREEKEKVEGVSEGKSEKPDENAQEKEEKG